MAIESVASPLAVSKPILSLIIPTHLRPLLLSRSLASVNAQAGRDQIEVIVVSDVIDSATDEVCANLLGKGDIYVRRNGAPGPSASRNLGLKLVRGQYTMFLDDDDAWQEGFCASLFAQLPQLPSTVLYFNCTVIKESRPASGPIKLSEQALDLRERLTLDVFVKNQVHMSCFMFSRHLLAGLEFDETMRAYEDWDFLLAVFSRQMPVHLPIACSLVSEVDDTTTDRRGSSAAATNFNAVIDYLYVYRRHAAPTPEIQLQRKTILASSGLDLPQQLL